MTKEQFDETRWTGGMRANYENKIYDVGSVCFQERLIGITGYCAGSGKDDLHWVRCENIELEKL